MGELASGIVFPALIYKRLNTIADETHEDFSRITGGPNDVRDALAGIIALKITFAECLKRLLNHNNRYGTLLSGWSLKKDPEMKEITNYLDMLTTFMSLEKRLAKFKAAVDDAVRDGSFKDTSTKEELSIEFWQALFGYIGIFAEALLNLSRLKDEFIIPEWALYDAMAITSAIIEDEPKYFDQQGE